MSENDKNFLDPRSVLIASVSAHDSLALAANMRDQHGHVGDKGHLPISAALTDADATVALVNRFTSLENLRDWTKLEFECLETLKRNPNFVIAHLKLGLALKQQDKLLEAGEALTQAAQSFPDDASIWTMRAEIAAARRSWEEAALFWREVSNRTDDRTHLARQSLALREAGQLHEAEEIAAQATRYCPEDALGWVEYARSGEQLRRPDAIQRWESASDRFPNFWLAVVGHGAALTEAGELNAAWRKLGEGINKFAAEPLAWQHAAVAAEKLSKWVNARNCWARYISLRPDHVWAKSRLNAAKVMVSTEGFPYSPSYNLVSLRQHASISGSGITFKTLDPKTELETRPPAFCLGADYNGIRELQPSKHKLDDIGVITAKDTRLARGFIISRDETMYYDNGSKISQADISRRLSTVYSIPLEALEPRLCENPIVLLWTHSFPTYGHWIVDIIPQLFILKESGYNLADLDFALPSYVPAFGKEILQMLGIMPKQMVIYDPEFEAIFAKNLLIPTWVPHWRFLTQRLRHSIDWMKYNITKGRLVSWPDHNPNKILVLRSERFSGRNLLNRGEIAKIAEAEDFTIFVPENHSLLDQWATFASAGIIIGEYGSAMHSTVFSQSGTIVGCLRGTTDKPGYAQSAIGEVFSQPTGYLFGAQDETLADGSYSVDPSLFRSCIKIMTDLRSLS